jgi:hypothetical protein
MRAHSRQHPLRAQSASQCTSQSDGRCGTFHWIPDPAEAPSRCKHFQSRRRPRSRLKGTIFTAQVPSADSPANRHQCARTRDRENGYSSYCNHNLHRILPRTPPDVADLLSARHLTAPRRREEPPSRRSRHGQYAARRTLLAPTRLSITPEAKPFGSLAAAAGDRPKRRPWRSHRNFPRAQRELFLS